MNDYLPKLATIEQACNWLCARTGETWILERLLEYGLTPWFWLDYTPGWTAIFGDRVEGYLAPMVFAPDKQRLEVVGTDALVNMTCAPDGAILKLKPGMRVHLSELRFKREAVKRVAANINPPTATAKPLQRFLAQEMEVLAAIKRAGLDPLTLPKNKPGKPGVKAATREGLRGDILFVGTTFDKTWARLLAEKPRRMAYEA